MRGRIYNIIEKLVKQNSVEPTPTSYSFMKTSDIKNQIEKAKWFQNINLHAIYLMSEKDQTDELLCILESSLN